jgi:thiamine pyrophosphokinase
LEHIRAVIVADGEVDQAALRSALEPADGVTILAIGADGGARHLAAAGHSPDLVVGDLDSLAADEVAAFRADGTAVDQYPTDKNESDMELAIRAALGRGATSLRIVGALAGARVEHAVANQMLLASPLLDGVDVAILHGGSSVRRIGTSDGPGAIELHGSRADFVSLLPLDDPVSGIATDGLRFPLRGEELPLGSTRGLSNELLGGAAHIASASGRLLVVHTPRSALTPSSGDPA